MSRSPSALPPDESRRHRERAPGRLATAPSAPRQRLLRDTPGAPYFHSYPNRTAEGDCGQAAMAMVADFLGCQIGGMQRDVYDEGDGQNHWDADAAVAWFDQNFGADVLHIPGTDWQIGTSGGQIVRALQALACTNASCGWAGVTVSGDQCWQGLLQWVNAGYAVPVLISVAYFPDVYPGAAWVNGHWPVIYSIDTTANTVWLANMNGRDYSCSIDLFRQAWGYFGALDVLGFQYCYVVAEAPPSIVIGPSES